MARLVVLVALLSSSCAGVPPEPAFPLSQPARLCGGDVRSDCRSPSEIEQYFADPRLVLLAAEPTHHGIQGAQIVTLRVPTQSADVTFRAKWRPISTTKAHTIPRRELAAYEVQKLILRPAEYVVPPTGGHCFNLDRYRAVVDPSANGVSPEISCVFGYLSYWLEDAEHPKSFRSKWYNPSQGPLDRKRLDSSPAYARSMARTNLVMYLIDHDDSHSKQFLMRDSRVAPVIYSVDNSMSFDAGTNPTLNREEDWSRVLVPLYPELLDRVRALDENDLRDLSVLEQYKVDSGRLVRTSPELSLWVRPTQPVGWRRGALRIGLSQREIDFLRVRIEALLKRVAG